MAQTGAEAGDGVGSGSTLPGAAGVPSRATITALRDVPPAYPDRRLFEERAAAAARLVAADARQHGLAAEQMLVVLKREWAELAEVRQLDASAARELLNRLVTLFIRAYYPAEPGLGAAGGGHDLA